MSKPAAEEGHVEDLEVEGIIGFDGATIAGLVVHPDGLHVVYPLGNKVTIQDWTTKAQVFLSGHTNIISALDVSTSGKYIASGQINHLGFKTRVIIWDFETHAILSQHMLHKVRVEAVAFSKDEQFCLSIGGRDCGSLIVWDVAKAHIVCGFGVSHGIQGEATAILTMNRRGVCFVTAGENHLNVWTIDREARKANSVDVRMDKLKRNILCLDVDERDEMCICGTSTGDVIKVRMNYHHDPDVLLTIKDPTVVVCMAKLPSGKVDRARTVNLPKGHVDLYKNGVRAIKRLFGGAIIIGAGDGTVELVREDKPKLPGTNPGVRIPSIPCLKVYKSTNVHASVTTITFLHNRTVILAGTTNSEIWGIDMKTFDTRLLITCHTSCINCIAFPRNFTEVFATGSKHDMRLWSMNSKQELLRIRVPNFSCSSVIFSYDGTAILTGWNDGIIRSFTPLTGRLIYSILNAHNKGVSALEVNSKGDMLVSGGCEGQVRLWAVTPYRQKLMCTLKEHRGPISSIHLNRSCEEAISASTDGSCIIWDLVRQCRRQILLTSSLFKCAKFIPADVQILTTGSDRKIGYWEVLDGSLVREVEGSHSGAINTLDVSPDGKLFVSGGNDQIVKLWLYQEGMTTHIGCGHSSVITATTFSPDGRHMVSASASGSIFIWKCPYEVSKESPARFEEQQPAVEVKAQEEEQEQEHVEELETARSQTDACCCCRCPGIVAEVVC